MDFTNGGKGRWLLVGRRCRVCGGQIEGLHYTENPRYRCSRCFIRYDERPPGEDAVEILRGALLCTER